MRSRKVVTVSQQVEELDAGLQEKKGEHRKEDSQVRQPSPSRTSTAWAKQACWRGLRLLGSRGGRGQGVRGETPRQGLLRTKDGSRGREASHRPSGKGLESQQQVLWLVATTEQEAVKNNDIWKEA